METLVPSSVFLIRALAVFIAFTNQISLKMQTTIAIQPQGRSFILLTTDLCGLKIGLGDWTGIYYYPGGGLEIGL